MMKTLLAAFLTLTVALPLHAAEATPIALPPMMQKGQVKNVQLIFTLLPLENDDKPHTVVSAGGAYTCGVNFENKEINMGFTVEGELSFHAPGNDVRLSYDGEIHWENAENKGVFRAKGTVLLKYGKPVTLGLLGEKKFIVKVVPLTAATKQKTKKRTGKGQDLDVF
jgi:hypothetical protein